MGQQSTVKFKCLRFDVSLWSFVLVFDFALAVISWRCVQNCLLHTAVELSKQYVWHHACWVWQQYVVWLFILLQALLSTLSDCSRELLVTHSLVRFTSCSHFTVLSKQYLAETVFFLCTAYLYGCLRFPHESLSASVNLPVRLPSVFASVS